MSFKMLPGPLVISMLAQLKALRETRGHIIKSKMETQGGFFSSKNQFNILTIFGGNKKK